ncbi:MAG: helix-hairpin-helix domain-containing protein [Phycisphaerales bacterium]|jgi:DNA uptake protein ComE-like DNA-binding protein
MRQTSQNKIQSFAFVISVCMAVCFSCGFASNLVGFESTSGRCKIELEDRINPNDAPVESLVRLPSLGIGRAGAVVAYRERLSKKNGDGPAFHNCNDLQKVKGIGPNTVQNISEWLKFE